MGQRTGDEVWGPRRAALTPIQKVLFSSFTSAHFLLSLLPPAGVRERERQKIMSTDTKDSIDQQNARPFLILPEFKPGNTEPACL